jgi:DedD protein
MRYTLAAPRTLDSAILTSIVDTHVKERLTGAIILVGVLVLLVPELLTGPKRGPAPAPPSADVPSLRVYRIDLTDDAHGTRATAPPVANEPATPEPQPMGAAPSEQPSPAAPEPSESAADSANADSAQVDEANAELVDETPANETSGAEATRNANAQAAAGSAQVKPSAADSAGAKPDARDVTAARSSPRKPGSDVGNAANAAGANDAASRASSSASKPASGEGWSIQVGSFASRANADRLASELKGKGFAASVSEGKSNGKKLFRVRVGPEPDKAAAQALGARLRAAGRAGSLVAEH